MKHERLMGIAFFFMRPPLLALCLCTAVALAYGVHWHQTNIRRRGRAPFSLVGSPTSRTVLAGGAVRYTIAIHRFASHRTHYRGKIKLSLGTVGPGLLTRWARRLGNGAAIAVHGQRAVITVKTASRDAPGKYQVHVRAVGGRYRGVLTLGLTITRPRSAPFQISGNFGPLWPGTSQAVDLALTNPNDRLISISRLTVSIQQVSAPRASSALPCSAADFSVSQFSGAYPLDVPAHDTVHLSDLGVAAPHGPQLRMLNRPVNQDGCQDATVTLAYAGTATSP
jgi:hypothetical protein